MATRPGATWGTGTPVLLLHGSLVTDPIQHWAALRPLADRFQLRIAVRSGYADHPGTPFTSMDKCVGEAVALLGKGAHLVGHSMGGLIAMCTAAARPDLVKSLTIVEAPAFAVTRGTVSVEILIERLAAQIGADWQVLTGRNHGVQSLGEPFNSALADLWRR